MLELKNTLSNKTIMRSPSSFQDNVHALPNVSGEVHQKG